MTGPAYTIDSHWFRSADGRGVLAGSPLTWFGVGEAGARVLDALENRHPLPAGHEPLTSRLAASGAVHPVIERPCRIGELTVVIPAFVRDDVEIGPLQSLVDSLRGARIVVVDDCSPVPVTLHGADVIRHDTNRGPGAARNTGARAADTPYIAFVDTDVTVTLDGLTLLAGHFSDPQVVAAAARVESADAPRLIGEYERLHSPLDLGAKPSVVRPNARVSHVPAAVLVVRADAFAGLGGFDEALRIGEDVDLVWRISESGRTCRYDPAVVAHHVPRRTVRALLRQRFSYGSSAAALDLKHPRAAAPVRTNLVLAVPALSILLSYVLVAFVAVPIALAWFAVNLRASRTGLRTRLQLGLLGIGTTIRFIASAVARPWWPLFLAVSFAPRVGFRIGTMFLFCTVIPPMWGMVRARPDRPFGYLALRILDGFAYGLGVWRGAFATRNWRCLLPAFGRSSVRLRSQG